MTVFKSMTMCFLQSCCGFQPNPNPTRITTPPNPNVSQSYDRLSVLHSFDALASMPLDAPQGIEWSERLCAMVGERSAAGPLRIHEVQAAQARGWGVLRGEHYEDGRC